MMLSTLCGADTVCARYGIEVCTLPLILSSDVVQFVYTTAHTIFWPCPLCMGQRCVHYLSYYLLMLSSLCTLLLILYSGPVHSVWGRDVYTTSHTIF